MSKHKNEGGMEYGEAVTVVNQSSDSRDELNDDTNEDEEQTIEVLKFGQSLPTIYYSPQTSFIATKETETLSNETVVSCSLKCHENCQNVVSGWTSAEKQAIRNSFLGLNYVKKKSKLLKHLIFQETSGISQRGFFFKQQLLCVNIFSHITSISSYLLLKVLKDHSNGYKRYIHGNQNKIKCQAASINFCSWMKVFSQNYGQDGPTDVVTVLPSYLNKAELFKLYSKEAPAPHVKLSTFYKLFKSKFGPRREDKSLPWIRISKASTHSKCDVCLALDQYLRKSKKDSELEYGRALKQQHTEKYSRARIAVSEYIQRSITYSNEVVSFQIDSMDNSKSMIPRILEKSKHLSGMFRLPSKITGCITTSSLYPTQRKLKFYINHGRDRYCMIEYISIVALTNLKSSDCQKVVF